MAARDNGEQGKREARTRGDALREPPLCVLSQIGLRGSRLDRVVGDNRVLLHLVRRDVVISVIYGAMLERQDAVDYQNAVFVVTSNHLGGIAELE